MRLVVWLAVARGDIVMYETSMTVSEAAAKLNDGLLGKGSDLTKRIAAMGLDHYEVEVIAKETKCEIKE